MASNSVRIAFYSVWAVLMTAVTYVLGAPPLKLLRAKLGRGGYWLLGIALTAGFYALHAKGMAIAFMSLVVLMGVFSELEEVDSGFLISGFFTLLINTLLGAGAFVMWASSAGPKWSQTILTALETMLKPLAELNPKLEINYFDLMLQLPSIIIMLWMCAIYLAVMLESRLNNGEAATSHSAMMRAQLAEVRMPDPVIWLFIVSLLGAFGGFSPKWVEATAVNFMNVCLLLFFFQGITVTAKFFETMRMGWFWQFLLMVVIIVHLALFVSLLGLMDYWVDFRARMAKRAEQLKRDEI